MPSRLADGLEGAPCYGTKALDVSIFVALAIHQQHQQREDVGYLRGLGHLVLLGAKSKIQRMRKGDHWFA